MSRYPSAMERTLTRALVLLPPDEISTAQKFLPTAGLFRPDCKVSTPPPVVSLGLYRYESLRGRKDPLRYRYLVATAPRVFSSPAPRGVATNRSQNFD